MKRVTMQQVADLAGVSRTTVSFVLNDTPNKNIPDVTRERVLKAANQLGYLVKQQRNNQTIALLVRRPPGHIVQAAFPLEVMRGLSATIEPQGYQVILQEIPGDGDFSYANWIKNHNPVAIAFDNALVSDMDELQQLSQSHVLISISQCSIPGVSYVDVDNVRGTHASVNHLLELGHRRVAMIAYASMNVLISNYRLYGYQQALANHGIAFDESLVRYADFTSESGQKAMADLLNTIDELPSAVFVASDVVAVGAMQAVRDHGLSIPDDISIVSFDDLPFARYLTPPLTTCSRPAYEIGTIVGQMLIDALKNNATLSRSVLLDSKLVIRESAAPYRSPSHKHNGS